MKVRVSPLLLNDALSLATLVAPPRATIPALTCVKLTAAKGKLDVCATDLELSLRFTIPAEEVSQEGSVVVPGTKFGAIIRELKDSAIKFSSDGPLGLIQTADSSFKIVGMDEADFPAIPDFDKKNSVTVESKDLSEMIRKTGFAVSTEAVRFALTGQLLELGGNEVRMVATDGKRLAYIRRPSEAHGSQKAVKVVVPSKTMGLLTRVLTPEDTTIALNIEETSIKVQTSRAFIHSRLIEGAFPDYQAVIPKAHEKTAVLEREPLLNALRRASIMTQDKARAVKFTFAEGKLSLYARSADLGEASVELPAEYRGAEFQIVFNPDYIIDYLKSVDTDKVELKMQEPRTAALFSAEPTYVYVLMPLDLDSI